MNKRKNVRALAVFTGLTFVSLLSGCGGSSTDNTKLTGSSSLATPTPTPVPTATPIPTNPATSSLFNVKFTTSIPTSTAGLHEASSWSKECSFSSTDTSRNLNCYLDMGELDVYFNSITMNWNAPVGMCDYVEVRPYWFFKLPPSQSASYDAEADSYVPDATNVNYSYTNDNGSVKFLHQNSPGGADLVQIVGSGTSAKVVCKYDYSWQSGGGLNYPNCCQGTGTVTVTTISGATTTIAAPVSSPWGGKWGNCAAGPAVDLAASNGLDTNGLPTSTIYYGVPGISTGFVVKSPGSRPSYSNIYSANYAENIAALSPLPIMQPSYFFGCYTTSHALIGSISIYLREWNSNVELAKKDLGDWKLKTSTSGNTEDNRWKSWYDYNTANPANPYPGLFY